jgi:hypothetical protein
VERAILAAQTASGASIVVVADCCPLSVGAIMKRLLLAALVGGLIASPMSAKSKTYDAFLEVPCSAFTQRYAESGLNWEDEHIPSWKSSQFGYLLSWIGGYLTYANKHVVLSGSAFEDRDMSISQSISWIGSWCRDHQGANLSKAIDAFIGR